MKDSKFNDLLQRYLDGKATPAEKAKLDAWLDARGNEETTLMMLSQEEEDILFQKIHARIANEAELKKLYEHPQMERKPFSRQVLAIAASVILVAVSSFMLWNFLKTKETTPVASGTAVRKVILADGTLVWLRGASTVSYHEQPESGTRLAEFDGEALFEVAKDPQHPFVITHNNVSIRVLGTSFNVNATHDRVEVKVLTGRVSMTTADDKVGVELSPNESALYTRTGGILKRAFNTTEVTTLTQGTEYDMAFTNATLEDIAQRLEGKFNVTVKFADSRAAQCRLTADFTDHSLESTLRLIHEVFDIRYTQAGSEVTLTGTCR